MPCSRGQCMLRLGLLLAKWRKRSHVGGCDGDAFLLMIDDAFLGEQRAWSYRPCQLLWVDLVFSMASHRFY
jgi:hypothetical protein